MIDSTNDEIEKIINTRMNNLGIIQNYSKWFACKYKLLYILFIFFSNFFKFNIRLIIRPDSLIQIENQNKPDKN